LQAEKMNARTSASDQARGGSIDGFPAPAREDQNDRDPRAGGVNRGLGSVPMAHRGAVRPICLVDPTRAGSLGRAFLGNGGP
jgi:hypothetical protein